MHPFAGIYFKGRIPVAGYNVIKADDYSKTSIKEVFNTQFRFGSKFNIKKDIAFQLYYLVGFNVMLLKYNDYFGRLHGDEFDESNNKNSIGFTTGGSFDVILKERFTIGMDYRYASNK